MSDSNVTPPPPPPSAPTPPPYTAAPTGYGQKTNTLAIVALVLGIVIPLGGIITGHIALSQIKKTGEAGHGLALAGTIIGYALTVIGIIWVVGVFAVVAAGIGSSGSFNNY